MRSVPQVLHPAVCIVSAWLYSTYYTGSGKLLDAQLWPVLGESVPVSTRVYIPPVWGEPLSVEGRRHGTGPALGYSARGLPTTSRVLGVLCSERVKRILRHPPGIL